MSTEIDDASVVYAPVGGGTAPRAKQNLSGTGTTEAHNSTLMSVGAQATLLVGGAAIRFSHRAAAGASTQVATSDTLLAAGARFDWKVTPETTVVYVEAGDGSASYEAWVWQSSPGTIGKAT